MRKIPLVLALLWVLVSIPASAFAAPPEPQEEVAVQDSQTGARLGCAYRWGTTLVEVWAATEGSNWYYTRPLGSQVKPVKTPSSGITKPINEKNCTQDGVPKPAPTIKVEVGNLLGCTIQKAGNGHDDRWVRVWEAKGKPGRYYALPTNYSLYPNAALEELGKEDFQSLPTLDGCPSVGPTIAESKRLSPTASAPTPSANASRPTAAPARPAAADQTTLVEDSFHLALPDGGIWLFLLADICLVVLIFFLVTLLAVANTVQMLQNKQTITLASWTKELLRMFHILRAPQPAVRPRRVSAPTTTVAHPPFPVVPPAPVPTAVVAPVLTQHPLPPAQAASTAPPPAPAPVPVAQVAPSNGNQPAAPVVLPPAPPPTPAAATATPPVTPVASGSAPAAPSEEPNPELVPIAASVAALKGRPLPKDICQQLADSATMADLLASVFEDGDTVSEETLAAVFADCQMNPEQIRDLQDYLADRGVLNDNLTVQEATYILLTQDAEAGAEEPEVETDDEVEEVETPEEDFEPVIPFLSSEEEAQVDQTVLDALFKNWAFWTYILKAGYPTTIARCPLNFDGGSKRTKGKPNTPPWTVDVAHLTGSFNFNGGDRITTPELAQEVIDLLQRSGVIDKSGKVTLPGWKSIYLFLEQYDIFSDPQFKYGFLALKPEERGWLFPEPQVVTPTAPDLSIIPTAIPEDDEEDILDTIDEEGDDQE